MQTSGRREEEHLNPTAAVQRRRRRKSGRLPARRRSHTCERRLFLANGGDGDKDGVRRHDNLLWLSGTTQEVAASVRGGGTTTRSRPRRPSDGCCSGIGNSSPAWPRLLPPLAPPLRQIGSGVCGWGGWNRRRRGGGVSVGAERRRRSYVQQHAVSVVAGANKASWKCDVENTDKGNQSGLESDRRPSGAPNLRPGVSSCQHAPPMLS